MQKAINQFNGNINAINEMGSLYHHLTNVLKLPNDLSDILRSQIVYSVSALDKLIHELVKCGMLQAFKGQRTKTKKFNDFAISLETYHNIQSINHAAGDILQLVTPEFYFEQEIILKHKHLAFQDPEKIADALSFIWDETQKWKKIACALNEPEDPIKKRLKIIVSRRNQIVHEADISLQSNLRNHIGHVEVIESIGQNNDLISPGVKPRRHSGINSKLSLNT
ncbi:MAG: hypothetical protein HRU77_00990 [Gammaproteobacteria bacterium]|nr:MAG: hypothetical protein HRU77_00990 [Gammaproteobacteria bacterium]